MLAAHGAHYLQADALAHELYAPGEPTFTVEVKDEAGDVVAEVQKVLHIRKK